MSSEPGYLCELDELRVRVQLQSAMIAGLRAKLDRLTNDRGDTAGLCGVCGAALVDTLRVAPAGTYLLGKICARCEREERRHAPYDL
jgi:hypothetical protein